MAKAKKKSFELGPAKFAKGEAVKCYGQNFIVMQLTKSEFSWKYELKKMNSNDSLWRDEHDISKAE